MAKFKKLAIISSAVLMTTAFAFGVAACEEETPAAPCTHPHEHATEWSSDADNHWFACKVEGCTEAIGKTAHTYNDGEVTTEATVDEAGVKTFTCTICGATKTESVDKLVYLADENCDDPDTEGVNEGVLIKAGEKASTYQYIAQKPGKYVIGVESEKVVDLSVSSDLAYTLPASNSGNDTIAVAIEVPMGATINVSLQHAEETDIYADVYVYYDSSINNDLNDMYGPTANVFVPFGGRVYGEILWTEQTTTLTWTDKDLVMNINGVSYTRDDCPIELDKADDTRNMGVHFVASTETGMNGSFEINFYVAPTPELATGAGEATVPFAYNPMMLEDIPTYVASQTGTYTFTPDQTALSGITNCNVMFENQMGAQLDLAPFDGTSASVTVSAGTEIALVCWHNNYSDTEASYTLPYTISYAPLSADKKVALNVPTENPATTSVSLAEWVSNADWKVLSVATAGVYKFEYTIDDNGYVTAKLNNIPLESGMEISLSPTDEIVLTGTFDAFDSTITLTKVNATTIQTGMTNVAVNKVYTFTAEVAGFYLFAADGCMLYGADLSWFIEVYATKLFKLEAGDTISFFAYTYGEDTNFDVMVMLDD